MGSALEHWQGLWWLYWLIVLGMSEPCGRSSSEISCSTSLAISNQVVWLEEVGQVWWQSESNAACYQLVQRRGDCKAGVGGVTEYSCACKLQLHAELYNKQF